MQVGDRVYVPGLQAEGEVTDVDEEENEVEVQVGSFRLRLPRERVEFRSRPEPVAPQGGGVSAPAKAPVRSEIDLRGMTVDEMLPVLEKYIDDAYLAGTPYVRIIHGKGTGALRRAVREFLRDHPLVASYRPGEPNEGGDGVTVVKFVGSE